MLNLAKFYDYLKATRSKATADAYLKGVRKLVKYMASRDITIAAVPKNLLFGFVQSMVTEGLSPKTIQLMLAGSRRFMRWLRENGIPIPELVQPDVPRAPRRQPEVVTTDLLERYTRSSKTEGEPYRTIFLLLPLLGARIDEMCSLKIDSIGRGDGGFALLFHGKGNKERRIPLSTLAQEVLGAYLRGNPGWELGTWLFPDPKHPDRHVTQGQVRNRMRTIRKEIGALWLTPHKMRHTCATFLRKAGVPIDVIRQILGHESIKTTLGYVASCSLDSDMRDAVERITDLWRDS